MSALVVEAQDAFLDLLNGAATFDGVHRSFIGDGKLPKTNELAIVLPSRNYRRAPGEQFDTATFDLALRVEVFRAGADSAHDCDARRWELIEAAADLLFKNDFRGFRTHGGVVAVEVEKFDLYDKGWVAHSEVTFGCKVWIG